jgi:hypothetical protein
LVISLFLFVIHASLAEVSMAVVILLAITGALVVLTDPLWLAGVALTLVFLTLAYARSPAYERFRLAGVGLIALTLLILPNRLSVGNQHGGNLFGDLTDRATIAASGSGSHASSRRIGMATYLFDRSPTAFAGGALRGLDRSLNASRHHGQSGLAGLVSFAIAGLGTLILLVIPRLRLLALLPLLIAVPTLFLASRNAEDVFAAGVPLWCAMLIGGALLVYVFSTLLLKRYIHANRRAPKETPAEVAEMRPPLSRS